MRLTTKFQCYWAIIAITSTIGLILIWLSSPPPPKAYPTPPIPYHSNSRLLPFRYWDHRSLYPESYTDETCMDFPRISDIHYASPTWQLLDVENGSVYVYGAYWDQRFEETFVRILVYSDVYPLPKLYCQLWYPNDNEPQTELADTTFAWLSAWGGPTHGVNEPYILTCRARRHAPEPDIAPVAAAVVTASCGVTTNVLNIQNAPFEEDFSTPEMMSPRNRTSVAVCVKWLHFRNDVSVRLVEWLQLLQHLGAEKAYLYIVRVHPNTRKVLNYYESSGFAVVTEVSHPPQVSGVHQPRYLEEYLDMKRELLPLNDCLYRNLGRHDWLAVIDLDELIVSDREETWPELIDRETAAAAASPDGVPLDALVFPNYYVLKDAQKDLVGPAQARMLSQTWRAKSPSPPGFFVKSFCNVSSVIAMHNHSPMWCRTQCRNRDLGNGTGKLLHYREKCPENYEGCSEAMHDVVRDTSLDKWRSTVLNEVNEVLKNVGLETL